MTAIKDNLTGCFFRTFDDEGDQNYHGQILWRQEAEYYVCQLFNWDGEPSCAKLAHVSEMSGWAFYLTEGEWRDAGNGGKNHGGALNDIRKDGPINCVFSL